MTLMLLVTFLSPLQLIPAADQDISPMIRSYLLSAVADSE